MASNVKMNLTGNGDAWFMGKPMTEDEERENAAKAAEIRKKEMEETRKRLEVLHGKETKTAEEIQKEAKNTEIVPNGDYILVKPFATNPYTSNVKYNNGIIGIAYDGTFKNPDSGEQDKEKQFIHVARVIEVGPKVKYIVEGDVVYYTAPSEVPVPFFGQGFAVVAEPRIMAIINEGVKARMKFIDFMSKHMSDTISIDDIPVEFGSTVSERINNYVAYKKNGIAIMDLKPENANGE